MGPRVFDPAKHCGANKKDGTKCKQPKGWAVKGTSDGPCKRHGGAAAAANLKTGVWAVIERDNYLSIHKKLQEQKFDFLDLVPAAELLWVQSIDYINRYASFVEALIAWHNSHETAVNDIFNALNVRDVTKLREGLIALKEAMSQRPRSVLDIAAVSVLVDRIGRMVERMHKI